MRVESKIAFRYLFSKKGHSAINIVSGVSTAAVATVTAAMVCVLSVMNGFERLIEKMFSDFDAELRITAVEGKTFASDDEAMREVRRQPYVAVFSEQIEETALVQYGEHKMPARLMGVDAEFERLTEIDSIIVEGRYCVWDGQFERTVVGRGLATMLGVSAQSGRGIRLYAPRRGGRVNMLRPEENFREAGVYTAGVFAVNQVSYDDRYMLVSLDLARELFEYDSTEVSSIGLSLRDIPTAEAKRKIQSIVGSAYRVEDRYEQQADFFRIVKIEKWLTALLLVFILCIAAFNAVSSLSILILDKTDSIRTLSAIGASESQIRRIFRLEGWLISIIGAACGIVAGLAICLSQQYWGWLTLGNGEDYVVRAYPVAVAAGDIVIITMVVLLIGYVAALLPSSKIRISHE